MKAGQERERLGNVLENVSGARTLRKAYAHIRNKKIGKESEIDSNGLDVKFSIHTAFV